MDESQKSDYKRACERCGCLVNDADCPNGMVGAKILCLSCIEADQELSKDDQEIKQYFEGPR